MDGTASHCFCTRWHSDASRIPPLPAVAVAGHWHSLTPNPSGKQREPRAGLAGEPRVKRDYERAFADHIPQQRGRLSNYPLPPLPHRQQANINKASEALVNTQLARTAVAAPRKE
ncbi:hypothetical protein MRX96_012338 [Rhipicephalus microplus]